VKIEGFWNKQIEGKKEYVKGRVLKWVVDSDKFSLCELMTNLKEEISWGSSQLPKIWFFDKNKDREVGISSESQIPNIFRMYEMERKISILVVICDCDGSSKYSGTNTPFSCTPSQPPPPIAFGIQVEGSQIDNNDGYVGFNEEHMYSVDGEDSIIHNGVIEESQIDSEPIMEENIVEEPNIDDVVECVPNIVYDPENPKIEVNALFPDVNAFRNSLRHFAIKNEFEVSTVKSDKKRFIGKCKHSDCPWRIRASILQDNKTFKVKMHTSN
jgi:MuDR family transposase